jgi:hypothetical protein
MSDKPPIIGGPLKYKMAAPPSDPGASRTAAPPPVLPKPRVSHWQALFRVAIVIIILSSIGVGYWSFFHYLAPLQKQSQNIVGRSSSILSRIDEMERRWNPELTKEVRDTYREVYAQLFANQAELEQWLIQVHEQAAPLALQINVGFGPSAPQAGFTNSLAVIPATISLEVEPEPGDVKNKSPYDRVLAFGEALAVHGKRADLAELTVTGGVGSISRALLVFNLWAGDPGVETVGPAQAVTTNAK